MGDKAKLSKLTWAVIIGTGVSRATFFMAFPFLAIHLKKSLGADLTTIGWILGVGPLAGSFVGFYGAYLSDLFGRRKIAIIMLSAWGLVQMGFGMANSLVAFALLSSLNGILRSITEPVLQAVISDQNDGEAKTKAYHYRYYGLNIAAAIGTSIGGWVLLKHSTAGFFAAGISLIAFALWFERLSRGEEFSQAAEDTPPKFLEVMKILAYDKSLICFVSASILCAIAYTQLETTLPILLEGRMGDRGVYIYGFVFTANALTIVSLQLFLNKWTKKFDVAKTVALSCIVFSLGFFGFGISGSLWWAYIVSMIVLALGEMLVFSNGFILIDNLAPKNLRGTYHSAGNMFAVGMAIGPPLGAYFLKQTNQVILFSAAAVLLLVCSALYFLGDYFHKRKLAISTIK
jgi:MFS family permease